MARPPIDAFDRPRASLAGDVVREGDSGAAARADHVHDRSAESSGTTFKKDTLTASSATPTWGLTYTPVTDSLHVYDGSAVLIEGTDYTLSGQTVTVLAGANVGVGDGLVARYAYLTGSSAPAALPTLVDTSGAHTASASSYTITIPSGASVGDLMLLGVSHRSSTYPNTPTGWTYYGESPAASGGTHAPVMTLFFRVAQAGDASTNVTLAFGGSQVSAAGMIVYRNVDATYPFSTGAHLASTASGTTWNVPVGIPATTNNRIVHFAGADVVTGTDTGTLTWGAGVTSRRSDTYSSDHTGFAIGDEASTASPTAARTLTAGNSSDFSGYVLVLNPSGVTPLGAGAYVTALVADTPSGLWMLGETTGTTMTDSSGNARHGSYVNGLPATATRLISSASSSLAASFTASGNKHGEVAYASWMDMAAASIEFWLSDDVLTLGNIVSRIDPGDGITVWSVRTRSGGPYLALDWITAGGGIGGPSGGGPSQVGNVALVGGRKYHVVITHSGTDLSCYIQGSLQSRDTAGSGFYTGALGHGGIRVVDSIARRSEGVAIYNYALTAAQVQTHFAAAMFTP